MRILTFAALASVVFAAANPLATNDQRELDELAKELSKSKELDGDRSLAYAQFVKTLAKYHVDLTGQIKADLDEAMDELVVSSVQKAVNNDPKHPRVMWVDTGARKNHWFGQQVPGGRYSYDNPDCIYRTIPIDAKYSYVIRGKRFGKGTTDASFSLISNPNSQQTINAIYKKDLKVNQDGSYTVTINSTKSSDPNHIHSDGRAKQLFVRHNLGDWNNETPDHLEVELVGHKSGSQRSNATILKEAKNNLKESSFFYVFGALDFKTLSVPVNTLKKPSQSSILGTLTSQASSFGHYDLKKHQALIITISPGPSDYWVVPISNFGLLTVGPGENLISYNNKQSVANKNGTYTFVLSVQDPGVHNWLNATGRSKGTMMCRWQGLTANKHTDIPVYTQVVDLDNLHKILPSETRYVDQKQRRAQVEQRRQGYRRLHSQ